MKITKFKNGNINLKLTNEKNFEDIIHSDDLFFNDLYFETFGTDFWYIWDTSSGFVYMFTDYCFDYFKELLEGKTVKLIPCGTIKDYQEA